MSTCGESTLPILILIVCVVLYTIPVQQIHFKSVIMVKVLVCNEAGRFAAGYGIILLGLGFAKAAFFQSACFDSSLMTSSTSVLFVMVINIHGGNICPLQAFS